VRWKYCSPASKFDQNSISLANEFKAPLKASRINGTFDINFERSKIHKKSSCSELLQDNVIPFFGGMEKTC